MKYTTNLIIFSCVIITAILTIYFSLPDTNSVIPPLNFSHNVNSNQTQEHRYRSIENIAGEVRRGRAESIEKRQRMEQQVKDYRNNRPGRDIEKLAH